MRVRLFADSSQARATPPLVDHGQSERLGIGETFLVGLIKTLCRRKECSTCASPHSASTDMLPSLPRPAVGFEPLLRCVSSLCWMRSPLTSRGFRRFVDVPDGYGIRWILSHELSHETRRMLLDQRPANASGCRGSQITRSRTSLPAREFAGWCLSSAMRSIPCRALLHSTSLPVVVTSCMRSRISAGTGGMLSRWTPVAGDHTRFT